MAVVRLAQSYDLEDVYGICCEVSLKRNIKDARQKGFLLADYPNHLEYKKQLTKIINDSRMCVELSQ